MLRRVVAFVLAVNVIFVPLRETAAKSGLTTYGDIAQYAIPAAAAALSGAKVDTDGLVQLLASGAVTIGLTEALKPAVGERRPHGRAHDSFPSGHASAAFMGASYVEFRYGWEWGIPFELAATAVAYSRVDAGTHHPQDVIASAIIAHASAFFLVDPIAPNVTLLPYIGGTKPTFGIIGHINF